jgi:hypothetical protein
MSHDNSDQHKDGMDNWCSVPYGGGIFLFYTTSTIAAGPIEPAPAELVGLPEPVSHGTGGRSVMLICHVNLTRWSATEFSFPYEMDAPSLIQLYMTQFGTGGVLCFMCDKASQLF